MATLLEVGLANAAMVAVLAAGVAVLDRLLRRPALVHGLWLLVLLKLVTPPLVAVPLAWDRSEAPTEAQAPSATMVAEFDGPLELGAGELYWVEPAPEPPAAVVEEPGRFEAVSAAVGAWWRPVAAAAWVGGSLAWLACATVRVRRFQRVLASAEPAPEELQDRVDWLSGQLGLKRGPDVRLVHGPVAPLVWAFACAPKLLVPAELWKRLDADQRSTLLIHELAHLRRRDHWVRHLELVATALYWWHPAVWWARHALREAEEQCCDAWVVWAMPKSARAYATALLETVDFLCEARSEPLPLGASGFGQVEHLKRRLTMILRGITPRRLSWAGKLSMTGLAAILLPILPTSAQQPAGEAAEDKEVRVVVKAVPIEEADQEVVIIEAEEDDEADGEKENKDGQKAKPRAKVLIRKKGAVTVEGRKLEKAETLSPEKKAELEKARAEVKEAEAQLRAAVEKLAKLEGGNITFNHTFSIAPGGEPNVMIFRHDGKGPHGLTTAPIPPIPPVPPSAPIPPQFRGVFRGQGQAFAFTPAPGQEKRIDALEKKLEKLLGEIESLKKQKDDE